MKSKSHALSVVMIHKKECFVAYACVMHFSASSCIHMGLCAIEMSVILILIILTVIYIPRPIHRRICTSRCSQKQADLFRGPVRELQLVEPMEDLFRGPVRELQLVEPMEDTGGSGRMKLNEEGGCETSRSMAGHCCQVTS